MTVETIEKSIEKKIQRHQAFWKMDRVKVPLVGIFFGGWSFFKNNRGAKSIWQSGIVSPDQLHPEQFIADYEKFFEIGERLEDDLIRAAQPFPSIPWMEAIIGCPIRCSYPNAWAGPMAQNFSELPDIVFDPDNSWVCKYIEFLEVFGKYFADVRPVSASILRGPSDLLSAAVGDTRAIYAYVDQPHETRKVLRQITEFLITFTKYQWGHMAKYCEGYIIPQNEIWVPGLPLRIQEDASALLSPEIYKMFLLPFDLQIVSLTRYNMLHLHTTSLFLLPYFLKMDNLGIIQVSKDDGYGDINSLIPYLQTIQNANKRLILRGRFKSEELELIRQKLSPVGFFIHIVVETEAEGRKCLHILKEIP